MEHTARSTHILLVYQWDQGVDLTSRLSRAQASVGNQGGERERSDVGHVADPRWLDTLSLLIKYR